MARSILYSQRERERVQAAVGLWGLNIGGERERNYSFETRWRRRKRKGDGWLAGWGRFCVFRSRVSKGSWVLKLWRTGRHGLI